MHQEAKYNKDLIQTLKSMLVEEQEIQEQAYKPRLLRTRSRDSMKNTMLYPRRVGAQRVSILDSVRIQL